MDYLKLTQYYNQLETNSKRLEKINIISNLLKNTTARDLEAVINLLRGKVFTQISENKTGVSTKLAIKALSSTTGVSPDKIEKEWAETGDLGDVAEKLTKEKKQRTFLTEELTVNKVFGKTKKLADIEGKGAVEKKINIMKEMLSAGSPEENKYLIRLFLEDLRIGVGNSVIRDAIVWTNFNVNYEEGQIHPESREKYNQLVNQVQEAYDLTNDFAAIIKTLKEKGFAGLKHLELKPGTPINPMLAVKLDSPEEAAESVGLPCLVDYKLDGFRVEVHYDGKKIKLFTRRMEDITKQFPDVEESVKKIKADNFVLDAEIMGLDPKTKKYLPFQKISQRIKRKHKIDEIIKKLPVELQVFDVIYYNNKSLIRKTQKERREILEKIIPQIENKLCCVSGKTAKTIKEIEEFYKKALKDGNEGIMVKNLSKPYTSGRKVNGWVKLKPSLENLDLVIIKAEWGTGKRAKQLSSFTVACKEKNDFHEAGKVSTGVKEKSEGVSYEELTKLLKPLIIKQYGKTVEVKPKVVIEVGYEEIQKSTIYSSGYALRFPRFISLRQDKPVRDIADLNMIKKIYRSQRHRKESV